MAIEKEEGQMRTKVFEIRDKGTFIPVIAVEVETQLEEERYLLSRAGYGRYPSGECVILIRAECSGVDRNATYDPYAWGSGGGRTYQVAHNYIIGNWRNLQSGDVIDVEFILGEKPAPKISERLEDVRV